MSNGCYFCERGEGVLQQHHIVPRRYGGVDSEENLVSLCPTCHRRLEELHDDQFYDEISVRLAAKNGREDRVVHAMNVLKQEIHSAGLDTGIPYTDFYKAALDSALEELNLQAEVCDACEFVVPPSDHGASDCPRCGLALDSEDIGGDGVMGS